MRVRSAAVLSISILIPVQAAGAVCTPTVQWVWGGDVQSPTRPMLCTTPYVAQLTDDNSDGLIDSADSPDVFFTTCMPAGGSCHIVVLDGATGREHFTIRSPEVKNSSLAAGDIDGDGIVEIVAIADSTPLLPPRLVAFENTGVVKWISSETPQRSDQSVVGIADLNQDGTPEISAGTSVFDATGSLLWNVGGSGSAGFWSRCTAADIVPGSAGMEFLCGRTASDPSGAIVWDNPAIPDGWTAIADFDGDGSPEVVLFQVSSAWTSEIYLLDHLGTPLGPPFVVTTNGIVLAHPLIADLDGDGSPEVVATAADLQVLEWSGSSFSVKWSQPVQDRSINGAVAFDFDADGASEIIYHDEEFWYIFDGTTGAIHSQIAFASNTVTETATIADIDNDCKTEILVAGCARAGSPNRVIAYECDSSAPARSIWNQYVYHATNVNSDGTIPRVEQASWQAQNSFLGQVSDYRGPNADAGPPLSICAGGIGTLDASASTPCDSAGLEYRWLEGATVVPGCDWSTARICDVAPTATTNYTLEISCLGSPTACVATDDVLVTVIVEPDLVPGDIGNTLRAIRSGLNVTMSWVAVANAWTFNLYRGTTKGVWPPPLVRGLTVISEALPDVPAPPDTYFYRVVGASCSGREGP